MGIFGTSSPFDQDVERATSETSTSEEWGLIMEICDRAGASAVAARDCLRAVLRRLGHPDPHVQVHAATLLDACVANCGRAFHLEVASRDFETEFRRLLSRAQPAVATRLRALLRKWADGEFRDDPQLDLIPSLAAKLRAEAGETTSSTSPTPASAVTTSASPSLSPGSAAAAAARRERDELARAIALSLRDAAPLYPRVDTTAQPTAAPAAGPPPVPVVGRKVRALYDFEAAEDNELTFVAGETVHVTDSSDPNWWKGYTATRSEGLFPANFVTGEPESSGPTEPEPVAAAAVEATPPAPVIEQEVRAIEESEMDAALTALHEADPSAPGPGEAELRAREARALRMGALVDAALERADTRHARLTQLSAELVDALNLYHELMRAPHAHPHASLYAAYPPAPPPPPPQHPQAHTPR